MCCIIKKGQETEVARKSIIYALRFSVGIENWDHSEGSRKKEIDSADVPASIGLNYF